jgi:amphi-Trp domain-containing protein
MAKQEIGVKRTMGLNETIKYLQELTASLKKGEVYVQQGNEYLTLKPREKVFLEVKAKIKRDKEKFTFSIGWYNEAHVTEGDDIKITSKKPEGNAVEVEKAADDDE